MHIDFGKMKWQNKIVMSRRNEKISASHTIYGSWIIVRISKCLRSCPSDQI